MEGDGLFLHRKKEKRGTDGKTQDWDKPGKGISYNSYDLNDTDGAHPGEDSGKRDFTAMNKGKTLTDSKPTTFPGEKKTRLGERGGFTWGVDPSAYRRVSSPSHWDLHREESYCAEACESSALPRGGSKIPVIPTITLLKGAYLLYEGNDAQLQGRRNGTSPKGKATTTNDYST